jgi:hypothetical protein
MLNSTKDKEYVRIVLNKRKTIGLISLSILTTLLLGSYVNALNTFYPISDVHASDYAPPTPEGALGETITYGFIVIGVVILAAVLFYSKDRILEFIT